MTKLQQNSALRSFESTWRREPTIASNNLLFIITERRTSCSAVHGAFT